MAAKTKIEPKPQPPEVTEIPLPPPGCSAGEYGPHKVLFTVDGAGRKIVAWCPTKPELVGRRMP